MKKISYKIKANTKRLVIAASILATLAFGATHTAIAKKALPHMAFFGIVAGMKKKNVWDSATPEIKAFAEAQDEALAGFLEIGALDAKMKAFVDAGETKGLTTEEQAEFKEMITGYKSIAAKLQKIEDTGIKNADGLTPVMKCLQENEGLYKKFLSKEVKSLDLQVKNSTQDVGDLSGSTIGYRVPGIGQIPVREPFMFDVFSIVPVNLEFIKYMDQATVVRDAKNVAGIATSTSTTKVTWIERNIQITKVRDFIDVNIDMMSDYDFVSGEVQNLINSSVILKADNGLLKGTGVYPEVHSVGEVASEFDPANTLTGTIDAWAGKVHTPTLYDLIIAMASQIIALGQDGSFTPNVVLLNTIDKYKNMLIKDTQGRYLTPPFVTVINNKSVTIDSMMVRTNPNVPANTCYVFDSTKGTIYMRKGMGLEMAYENSTNFEKEVVTIKSYMRFNLLIRNVNANAFMKCSDINAALTLLASA